MDYLKYTIVPLEEDDEVEKLVEEKLDEIDDEMVDLEDEIEEEELVFKIENEDGEMIAGCILDIDSWMIADLDILWVDERYRKRGLGSALIRQAEKAAKERGCYLMTLGTFDFQAKPLYLKHGFSVCGTIPNWPTGQENYCMRKLLDEPSADYVPTHDDSAEFVILEGTEEDAEFICKNLGSYNRVQVPSMNKPVSLSKKVLDEDGNPVGAIIAEVGDWKDGFVNMIWVDEPYRNQGIGSELIAIVEREMKEQGATLVLADPSDWQDAIFRKNGYTVCSTQEDCPKGHLEFVMYKDL